MSWTCCFNSDFGNVNTRESKTSWEEEVGGEVKDSWSNERRVEENAGGEVWEVEPVLKCRSEYSTNIFQSQLKGTE